MRLVDNDDEVFLSVSAVTDAARIDNDDRVQEETMERLQNEGIGKYISPRLKERVNTRLRRRDDLYKQICRDFSEFEIEDADKGGTIEKIEEVMDPDRLGRVLESDLDQTTREGIKKIRADLIERSDEDPYEYMQAIRQISRVRVIDTRDMLEERIEEVDESVVNLESSLFARTEDILIGQTCSDAAGWWNPQRTPVPLAIGAKSMISMHLDDINEVLLAEDGCPSQMRLFGMNSQALAPISKT